MDALSKAEDVLDRAADVYERQQNGDGLHQVATTWLQLWDVQRSNGEKKFGFSNEHTQTTDEEEVTDAYGESSE